MEKYQAEKNKKTGAKGSTTWAIKKLESSIDEMVALKDNNITVTTKVEREVIENKLI